ncbi:MAG: ribosome assembly RNA-binding protein YhbY [Deltaproteobacteria bacterium]|nr:ribosome assembly RNA-binding protein YhbY [Deltaproteobacteria bacterium]
MTIRSFQRQYLKGLAHDLNPVLQTGKDGLSEAFIAQVTQALLDHELIKVRLVRPEEKKTMAQELANSTNAEFVGLVGHTVILFRPHPEEPKIVLPIRE